MKPVFVLPGRIKDNPYLTLLYDAIRAHGDFAPQSFSWIRLWAAIVKMERPIVHVHWETNIYGSKSAIVSYVRGTYRFFGLGLAQMLGATIVWTMHNAASHDYPHPLIDKRGRELMWRLADAVIIQNRTAISHFQATHPDSRIQYIPHGNYVGVYGPRCERQNLSRRGVYGLGVSDIVLIALGAIRPYKKYESLIDVVVTANKKDPRLKLLIVGKGNPKYIEGLHRRAGGSTAVVISEGHIPETEMAAVLSVADFAVFAYGETSLTSGALILALSYGVPSIVASMPADELVINGINGYRAGTEDELVEIIKRLPTIKPLSSERVVASIESANWENVAQQTEALYRSLSVEFASKPTHPRSLT